MGVQLSSLSALTAVVHCVKGGGSEVLMQVTRSVRAKIHKWLGRLGLLGKNPVVPYGPGAP